MEEGKTNRKVTCELREDANSGLKAEVRSDSDGWCKGRAKEGSPASHTHATRNKGTTLNDTTGDCTVGFTESG